MKKLIFINDKLSICKESNLLKQISDFLGDQYLVIIVDGLEKTLEVFEV